MKINVNKLIGNRNSIKTNIDIHTFHTPEEQLNRYKKAINYGTKLCPVCGKKFVMNGRGYIINVKPSIHHICRFPEVTVILCKECHRKVEMDTTGKYKTFKPIFTRKEINVVKDILEDKYNIKHKASKIEPNPGFTWRVVLE